MQFCTSFRHALFELRHFNVSSVIWKAEKYTGVSWAFCFGLLYSKLLEEQSFPKVIEHLSKD